MHSRLFLTLGSVAWLITAHLASAEELGTEVDMDKANNAPVSDVSSGNENTMPTDVRSGVEYRRNDRSGENSRTGRNDRSGARGQSDSSGGGEGGEGGGGEGGGESD